MSRDHDAPSRSARKRDSEALQALGERLVELPAEELARIPLPEDLAAAVHLARGIKERGGRRRQLQYIGKLMRRFDAGPIAEALGQLARGHAHEAERFHRAEQWRDRLLREGHGAVAALCAEFPAADAAQLNELLGEAAKEAAGHRPPHAARVLFRYLRDEVLA